MTKAMSTVHELYLVTTKQPVSWCFTSDLRTVEPLCAEEISIWGGDWNENALDSWENGSRNGQKAQ